VVVLLTEWTEFREIAPEAMAAVVGKQRIFDGRHALDSAAWRAAGWEYKALGRP
jgi:UDPglucose 6-dehydrogenase